MFNVVLFESEIPPNTGNIIRLCVNTGSHLHLIHPLTFDMDQKSLRCTGLDYIDSSIVHHYDDYQGYFDRNNKGQLHAIESNEKQRHTDCHFSKDASVIFDRETLNLPADILEALPAEGILQIPIKRKTNRVTS